MIAPETMFGPYKIVDAIGAGGMGEVYRAIDTRLDRQVAVKVLSPHLTHDAEATHRFEQEARAAGQLNHPNVLAIYDIGIEGDRRYIVSELLEGESMRARIRQGAIPARRAADYASQVARGLGAAHDRGIIHRDLKPENLFITRDGIVKILDFGLVKLMKPRLPGGEQSADEHQVTLPGSPTEPGRILGTVGYMAPEQIRGASGDHRSDVFAFGAILFEMLTARPAFRGDSPIETLNAILKEDPPDFVDVGVRVPNALERVVRHCLEKNPDDRFQSARDLAFDIGAMSGLTSQAITMRRMANVRPRDVLVPVGIGALVIIALAAAYLAGTRFGRRPPPSFKRVTFRSGTILSARLGPDGQTIFFGARWAGRPSSVFSVRGDSPESRDLGFGASEMLSVSSTGQLAILLQPRFIGYLRESGTLAQVPIAGGAPRQLIEDVEAAEWSPDGKQLAVVRSVDGRSRLEFPIGKTIYTTVGWISHPRFNAPGDRIAFVDHPFVNDDRGSVASIATNGSDKRQLTAEYTSVNGVAWRHDRDELWFAAERALYSVRAGSAPRLITTSAGWLWLHDIAPDGRVLASEQTQRGGIIALVEGEPAERDLSWLDYSVVRDLSADGKTIAFSESGEAGGSLFGVYLRSTDGSPAVRLGEGTTEGLSPDGKWVLSIPRNRKAPQIVMLPTGAGQPRAVTNDSLSHRNARWFPDNQHILFQASESGKPAQLWMQSVSGGPPRALTPENATGVLVTTDSRRVLGRGKDRRFFLFPVDGSAPQPVPVLKPSDVPIRFANDGVSVYVGTFGRIPAQLEKVNLLTGARATVRELRPADPAGLINVGPVFVTPDERTIVYSYTRLLSDLVLVEWK
jgi:serine/threonine protein kinase/Tol biopolymer transport system component